MNIYELFKPEAQRDFDKLKSDEAKRLFCQQFFKQDFKALVYLLGYRDMVEFHQEAIEELGSIRHILESQTRRLWLWSRGFFKTSIITIAHSIYLIVNNPDIRMLLVSYTMDVAKDILKEMKGHFMHNQDFRYFFREYCPVPNKEDKIEFGTTEMFTIPQRKAILKEPTIKTIGVGTNITALHFDWMKIDDLVNKESVNNDTQIQASKDYYSYLRPFFVDEKYPREDICGSIYHFNDLYCSLIKSNKFKFSFIPCRDAKGQFPFPKKIDEAELEKMFNDPTIGPDVVNTQYLLNPRDPAKATFKERWLKYYDELPDDMAEYICVDPASVRKKKSDYTVIERWGINWQGKHHLLEGIRDKLTSFQRIDKLFEFVSHAKNLKWVKYEVLGGRHGDLEVIKQKQAEKQIFFEVKETKATTANKRDRVEQRLVGPYNAGVILLPRNLFYKSEFDGKTYDFVQDVKLEFLQFPFTEHDDCVDCQSQMFEEPTLLVKGKEPPKPPEETEMTMGEYAAIKENREKDLLQNPWQKFHQPSYR